MKTQIVAITPSQNNWAGQLYINPVSAAEAGDPISITGAGGIPGQSMEFGGTTFGPLYGTTAPDGSLQVFGEARAAGALAPITVTVIGTVLGGQSCQFAPVAPTQVAVPGIALLAAVADSLQITPEDFPKTTFACMIPPFSQPVTTQIGGFVFLSESRTRQIATFLGAEPLQDYIAPWTPAQYPSLVGPKRGIWY